MDALWGPFQDELMELMPGADAGNPQRMFEVYDAFLDKTYNLRVVLGMVSADSIMRIAMGRFIGVGGYRSDIRATQAGSYFSPFRTLCL